MRLIAIDIGNSAINIGFFIDGGLFVHKMNTYPLMSAQKYKALVNKFIKEKNIDKIYEGVIISSVVPGHTSVLKEATKSLSRKEPLILTCRVETGIDYKINEPERLGTDRIAASVGACGLFGAPIAVIDFGTATTVNFIGSGNIYKGGAIMPGIKLMKNALFAETAQLPDIAVLSPLSSPIGKDTRENILSGIIYGTAGAVEKIIHEAERIELENFKIVLTGGYSHLVAPLLRRVDHIEPDLVLKGLKFIHDRAAGRREGTHNA